MINSPTRLLLTALFTLVSMNAQADRISIPQIDGHLFDYRNPAQKNTGSISYRFNFYSKAPDGYAYRIVENHQQVPSFFHNADGSIGFSQKADSLHEPNGGMVCASAALSIGSIQYWLFDGFITENRDTAAKLVQKISVNSIYVLDGRRLQVRPKNGGTMRQWMQRNGYKMLRLDLSLTMPGQEFPFYQDYLFLTLDPADLQTGATKFRDPDNIQLSTLPVIMNGNFGASPNVRSRASLIRVNENRCAGLCDEFVVSDEMIHLNGVYPGNFDLIVQ